MYYCSPFDNIKCSHIKRNIFGGLKNQNKHTCKYAGTDKCSNCISNTYINKHIVIAKKSCYKLRNLYKI
ncbi:unnamed protein product [marine sediment metagenome]|uniref:Uncharacterized protein n=1 Tax=marine sediment metagenome TaxID=412755 RepID=X0UGS1_9ZZZZ